MRLIEPEAARSWRSLADFIRVLREGASSVPLEALLGDVPSLARYAQLSRRVLGADADDPAVVNIWALAHAFARAGSVTLHEAKPSAVKLVRETDLRSLPAEPPKLLQGPWLIQASRPRDEALVQVGDHRVVCLGGYSIGGRHWIVGLGHPYGIWVTEWLPSRAWGHEVGDDAVVSDSHLVEDPEAFAAWALETVRFAITFGLLLEADGSPMALRDERPDFVRRQLKTARASRGKGGGQPRGDWITRHVYLDMPQPGPRPSASVDLGPRPAEGYERVTVKVRGHLKRQPYGPKGALRKWHFVAGYEAPRWVRTADHRVIVHGDREIGELGTDVPAAKPIPTGGVTRERASGLERQADSGGVAFDYSDARRLPDEDA